MTRSSGADAGVHRADLLKDRCHPCSPDVGAGPGCLRGLGGTWRPRAAGVRRGVWGRGRLGRGARPGRHGARRPEEGGARRRGRRGEVRARSGPGRARGALAGRGDVRARAGSRRGGGTRGAHGPGAGGRSRGCGLAARHRRGPCPERGRPMEGSSTRARARPPPRPRHPGRGRPGPVRAGRRPPRPPPPAPRAGPPSTGRRLAARPRPTSRDGVGEVDAADGPLHSGAAVEPPSPRGRDRGRPAHRREGLRRRTTRAWPMARWWCWRRGRHRHRRPCAVTHPTTSPTSEGTCSLRACDPDLTSSHPARSRSGEIGDRPADRTPLRWSGPQTSHRRRPLPWERWTEMWLPDPARTIGARRRRATADGRAAPLASWAPSSAVPPRGAVSPTRSSGL